MGRHKVHEGVTFNEAPKRFKYPYNFKVNFKVNWKDGLEMEKSLKKKNKKSSHKFFGNAKPMEGQDWVSEKDVDADSGVEFGVGDDVIVLSEHEVPPPHEVLGEALQGIKEKEAGKNLTPCQKDKRFRQRIMTCMAIAGENPKTSRVKCILGLNGIKFRRFQRHPVSNKPIMASIRINFDQLRKSNDENIVRSHIESVIKDFEMWWDREDQRIEKENKPKKKIMKKIFPQEDKGLDDGKKKSKAS